MIYHKISLNPDFSLVFVLLSCLSGSLGLCWMDIKMEGKTKKPFSPKGGKKFTQKGKGEWNYEPVMCTTSSLQSRCVIGMFQSVQIQWGPNSVGNRAINQAVKSPLNRTTVQTRRTDQGSLQMVSRTN